jgi:hypothetical protein
MGITSEVKLSELIEGGDFSVQVSGPCGWRFHLGRALIQLGIWIWGCRIDITRKDAE